MSIQNESDNDKWHRMLVTEKTKNFSDFLSSKKSYIASDSVPIREQAITDIHGVICSLPNDFLQNEEVALIANFFMNLLNSSPLAGDVIIRTLHHLTIKWKNLPENFENRLFRVLFQEGNLQSWARKERDLQYEILNWLLKKRMHVLKGMGSEFLSAFIRSVSGERDPRCLVQMFRAFLEVSTHFPLGPFTEDMFEIIACYFPVEFRPQNSDSISREYLAASCISCLVASQSFAPFCFLFIDEKLNDEECSDDECKDVLDLLVSACDYFSSGSIRPHLESLLDGVRKVLFNPKSNGELDILAFHAFRKLMVHCANISIDNEPAINEIINFLLENSEPFVLQAEMGLCSKALNLLCCAFKVLPQKHSRTVLNQSLAWILNLVQGRSVNAAGNMGDVVEEGLQCLVKWIQLVAEEKTTFRDSLERFERSIFESCCVSREYKPRESRIAIYKCATAYLNVNCASEVLVSDCEDFIAKGLCSTLENEEKKSFLAFLEVFTSSNFDTMKNVLDRNPIDKWNRIHILPMLCSIASSKCAWDHLETWIVLELEKQIALAEDDDILSSYVELMLKSANDDTLKLRQHEVFDNALLMSNSKNSYVAARILQEITLMLSSHDHQMFMDKLTRRYSSITDDLVSDFDKKYSATYLQNTNTDDLISVTRSNLSQRTLQQLKFAACNRNPEKYGHIDDRLIELKAKLLSNYEGSMTIFDCFLEDLRTGKENDIERIAYLLDFESIDMHPERCRYVTASPLWRQRMFFQIVPAFTAKFDAHPDGREELSQILPFLLKFASPLNCSFMKQQFHVLLPVLIQTIRSTATISAHVTCSVPMFLAIAEHLEPEDLHSITTYLCYVLKRRNSSIENLEHSLNSFAILAERQPSKALHSEMTCVIPCINRILGHKKRLLRVMAAHVKNSWEMIASR